MCLVDIISIQLSPQNYPSPPHLVSPTSSSTYIPHFWGNDINNLPAQAGNLGAILDCPFLVMNIFNITYLVPVTYLPASVDSITGFHPVL